MPVATGRDEDEKGETNALPSKGVGEWKKANTGDVKAEASGDLSACFGQQIAFSDLLASGALKKNSDGMYASANEYMIGEHLLNAYVAFAVC